MRNDEKINECEYCNETIIIVSSHHAENPIKCLTCGALICSDCRHADSWGYTACPACKGPNMEYEKDRIWG